LSVADAEDLAAVDYRKTLLGRIPPFLFDTNCLFLIIEDHEIVDPKFYYHIMNNIHDLCERLDVSPTRFTLCDNSVGELDKRKKEYYSKYQTKAQIGFIGLSRFESMTATYYSGHTGVGKIDVRELEIDLTQKRSKRFLSLNRRARSHRTAMIMRLYDSDLLDNFHFSWGETDGYYDSDFDFLFPDLDWSGYQLAGMEKTNTRKKHPAFNNAPYHLDGDLNMEEKGPPYFGPFSSSKEIYPFVRDSYISLVSETDISSHYTFLTEKTFKRFAWKHPFLIWGNPHSLKSLQRLGYKTFGDWFDEGYDSIIDPKERFDVLFAEIERLSALL